MSWVLDALREKRLKEEQEPVAQKPALVRQEVPKDKIVWDELARVMTENVAEFDGAVGTSHRVQHTDSLIQVTGKRDTSTIAITKDGKTIHLV